MLHVLSFLFIFLDIDYMTNVWRKTEAGKKILLYSFVPE